MKKLIVTIALFALMFTGDVSVMAADEFATSADLFQYWEETSYPDYVCGVWSNDGTMNSLTIAVQNNEAGNAGKQEILNLIADDSTITFTYQQYSKNYLYRVQEEIFHYLEKGNGLVSTGVDEYKNRLVLGIHEKKINEASTQKMLSELYEKYGDVFLVESSSGIVATLENTLTKEPAVMHEKKGYIITVLCVVGIGIMALTLAVVVKKKNSLFLQTTEGTSISGSVSLSTKDVENIVKNSNAEVTSEIDSIIMNEIEKR